MKWFKRIFVAVILALAVIFTRTWVFENGENYCTKNEVALYIYKYKHCPSYVRCHQHYYSGKITKKTKKHDLTECDVYKKASDKEHGRGKLRLVHSNDCKEVFYTADHYKSFRKVHRWQINWLSNILLAVLICQCCYIGECVFEKD